MSLHVFLLVLASAAVHVTWNVLARSARGSARFAWLANVAGAAILLPGFVARRFSSEYHLDAQLVGLAAWSALFEAAYFILLHKAYGASELSIVYPLSRGIAPLLALAPARFLTGDGIETRELFGLAVVLIGTACVATSRSLLPAGADADAAALAVARARARRGAWLALLTGAATAAYQLIDRKAMQLVKPGAELDYLFEMQVALAVLLTGWWWTQRMRERTTLRELGAADRDGPNASGGLPPGPIPISRDEVRRAVLAGIAIQLAYYLILLALRDGNVALVAAARNVGIPLSLLAGWYLLRERIDRRRLLGALLITAGVLLLLQP